MTKELASKKTKEGFFNLQGYLDWCEIDYEKDISLLILTAVRNMGKSTGTWKWIDENIWKKYNYKWKIAFIRTTLTQSENNYRSFEESFKGEYRIRGNIIQKIVYKEKTFIDKDTKEKSIDYIIDEQACFEIGRILDVKNEHNYRSGAGKSTFEDYHFAFWDEFNEIDQQDPKLYQKFVNLFSTIRRVNKPFTFLIVGNKINANNDLFTYLSLDTGSDYKEHYQSLGLPYQPRNTQDDFKQRIDSTPDVKIYYVDIGLNTFNVVSKSEDIVAQVAKFNPNTNALYNEGAFLSEKPFNVLNSKLFINKKPQFIVGVKENFFLYSICGKESDCISFEIISRDEMLNHELPLVAFDSLSFLIEHSRKFNDDETYKDLFGIWIKYSRQNKLFYDSFETKIIMDDLISHSIRLYKIDKV